MLQVQQMQLPNACKAHTVSTASGHTIPAGQHTSGGPTEAAAAKLTAAFLHERSVQLLRLVNGLPLLIQLQVPHVQLAVLAARRQQRATLAACLASATAASKLRPRVFEGGTSGQGRARSSTTLLPMLDPRK